MLSGTYSRRAGNERISHENVSSSQFDFYDAKTLL